jgi:hypothetical protein
MRGISAAFQTGNETLATSPSWTGLSEEQRAFVGFDQLKPVEKEAFGTDDEILAALRERSLSDRRNLLDAIPHRFSRVLNEASKLLEPKAQRIVLPPATIRNEADLEAWLSNARQRIEEKLKDGPVIL